VDEELVEDALEVLEGWYVDLQEEAVFAGDPVALTDLGSASVTHPAIRESPWPVRADGLLFREAVEADIVGLQSFRNDPDVNRFMVRTYVEPDELRREWLAAPSSPTDYSCVVERDGRIVAMAFLDIVDGSGQPGHPTGTDGVIGYIVHPEAVGQGIGSATARALLRAAFDGLGLRRVTAAANADNIASVRVLESAGMRRERHSLKALWHQELGWLDEVEYALLDEEWAELTSSGGA
jgi:RimJ/RimL family protein N-acetyltransferase